MTASHGWLARVTTLACALALASCGGGGGGDGVGFTGGGSGGGSGGGGTTTWTPGVFPPAAQFQARCEAPRSGNDPSGNPWPDIAGSTLDENNYLRSYSDDTYLWYNEIVDRDPSLFSNPVTYFDELRTNELTPSGTPKDNFHFTVETDEWLALSQSGVSGGYGAQFAVIAPAPPREIVVAYTNPGTPATANGLERGAEILRVDGVDAVNGGDITTLNDGLFPNAPGEVHQFEVRDPDGTVRTFSMTSANITTTPVQNVGTLPAPNNDVGYMLFNDHIATSEQLLVNAITQLRDAGVTDLVLDLRYNGGGFLAIASQLAYMISGPMQTGGRTFELLQFNDKYPSTNPVTGQPLSPIPFYNQTLGIAPGTVAGRNLPFLNLSRVFVITGAETCSASESIMNGLRGVNVEVIQIGSTTCGKPYGFYPTDNCGTTYFTIQFRGVNDQNFGDYPDGFSPANTNGFSGVSIPGCSVADDFSRALGDPAERRLAAALQYRNNGSCPSPSGVDAPPEVSSLRLGPDDSLSLPREPWRENRMLTLP